MAQAHGLSQRAGPRVRPKELAYERRRFGYRRLHALLRREGPAIEVDASLPGVRVTRVLVRLAETGGRPQEIVLDNGPEMTGQALDKWASATGSGGTSSSPAPSTISG
jgi:putative transposase